MAEAPSELVAEITDLERKHAENPEGRYFVPLAKACRKAGGLARAETLLREGLIRHPDYLSAHIVLGWCLMDRDAASEAAGEFRHVLGIDPQNLIALRTLGEIAAAQGRDEEAEHWYRELLAVDPMNEDARAVLERIRPAPDSTAGEPVAEQDEPVEEQDEFIELDPVVLEAERTGENGRDFIAEAALESNDETLGGEDESGEVVTETLADLYTRQGFHDRAAEVYRELLRRRGEDAELRRRLDEVEAHLSGAGTESSPTEDLFADSFAQGFAGQPRGSAEPAPAEMPEVSATPTIAAYLGGLLAWTSGPGETGEEAEFSFDTFFPEEETAVPDFAPPPRPPPAAAPGASAETAPLRREEDAGTHEDDEDLESFQAWLRSLKR